MMQIVYFTRKEELASELSLIEVKKEFVAPSPAKADGLRAFLGKMPSSDVLTISKFASNLIKSLWSDQDIPIVKKKADLLLIFGILKSKYFSELNFEQFSKAYNLFSDLRSYSLNLEALSDVLEEQPEIIKDAVILFWKLLKMMSFCDDHEAYHLIAERLRSSQEIGELKKMYIFWGFQHLNGHQVDLIKALSIRYDVIIPFPLALKEKIKKTDWISWIKDSQTLEREHLQDQQAGKVFWTPINSREISLYLKDFLKEGDQIVLGVSKLEPSHMELVPSKSLEYKIPLQILEVELNEIYQKNRNFSGTFLDFSDFCKEKMSYALNLKQLKAWQLYLDAVEKVLELTDDVLKLDEFYFKLLHQVTILNQPRTSYVPSSKENLTISLKDMSSLDEIHPKRRIVICIDDRFDEVQSLSTKYTENVQRYLSALGPIKRGELDLLFKKCELKNFFSHSTVHLFMSPETLKHSLVWKMIFSEVNFVKYDEGSRLVKKITDPLKPLVKLSFNGDLSASKIQTFLDCPRKFYFNYVERIFPVVKYLKDFDQLTSGSIIHEIIEEYYKKKLSSDDDLKKVVSLVMDNHILLNKLLLPHQVYEQKRLVFYHRTRNGINFIETLSAVIGEHIDWKIETPFEFVDSFTMRGKIDCIGESKNHLFFLDFKSTEFSASSFAEVNDFFSIQLWVYLLAASKGLVNLKDKTIILGYVVLDDPAKSTLMTFDEELIKTLKTSKICKTGIFKQDFSKILDFTKDKILGLADLIFKEKKFSAIPRKVQVCQFCELNQVCVKSEVVIE